MILASVVLPEPGGPQKMHDPTSPRRMSSPSALPGPRRFSWPRKPSRVRGRIRAASGAAERWKREGSDTGDGRRESGCEMGDAGCAPRPGCEMRDAGCVRQSNPFLRDSGTLSLVPRRYLSAMRRLQKLDTSLGAQELALAAYLLTTTPTVSKHFALVDQIRRAAISIPANIAEGYALGTTAQFVRCLRIVLGSATELHSHLTLLRTLKLAPEPAVAECLELSDRVIAMVIGLLRKLTRR